MQVSYVVYTNKKKWIRGREGLNADHPYVSTGVALHLHTRVWEVFI
jgi:hypothetical protein